MQYRAKIAVIEAIDGAAEQHFGIADGRSKHCVINAVAVRDLASVVCDGEDALSIGVSTPDIAVGGCSPEGLIGAMEGVPCDDGAGR